MSGHGGRRPGAGRKPGTRGRNSHEVAALVHARANETLAELARLARESKSDTIRIAAMRELLNRGHGKVVQLEKETVEAKRYHVRDANDGKLDEKLAAVRRQIERDRSVMREVHDLHDRRPQDDHEEAGQEEDDHGHGELGGQ